MAMNAAFKALARRSDLHLLRKTWHVLTGSAALYGYYTLDASKQDWAFVALVIGITGIILDIVRMKSESFNNLAVSILGPIMRQSEKDGFSGLPFYALGSSISLYLFQEKLAILSIFFLVFADPISSLFGILLGKDKILPNKSIQGSMAGFFTCYLITMLFLREHDVTSTNVLVYCVIAGIIGSLSELLSAFNIDDNLTIPVVSGLGLTVLNYFLPLL